MVDAFGKNPSNTPVKERSVRSIAYSPIADAHLGKGYWINVWSRELIELYANTFDGVVDRSLLSLVVI